MNIVMAVQTRWNGKVLKPGDCVEVPDTVANRWLKNKIAVKI